MPNRTLRPRLRGYLELGAYVDDCGVCDDNTSNDNLTCKTARVLGVAWQPSTSAAYAMGMLSSQPTRVVRQLIWRIGGNISWTVVSAMRAGNDTCNLHPRLRRDLGRLGLRRRVRSMRKLATGVPACSI